MSNIKIFEDKRVRVEWDADKEDWWFSVIIEILTDSPRPRVYWGNFKGKIKKRRK